MMDSHPCLFLGQNALGLVVFSFTSVAPKTLSLSQHVHDSHDSHLPPLRLLIVDSGSFSSPLFVIDVVIPSP